ncbi:hypothetical protein Pan241w_56860 [Gimesia alba]|uniref:Uncharacterized protein n=1 Tax=Gimesia alba TaxID=2527973 RepID=A0A517RNU9_9PLAN|nr:hypothetical protein [Gimesia alba]QDT45560.1 hypothetical protein Pan241w_56860 [Gimesia alba]
MNSAFYTTTRLFLKRAWAGALLAVGTLVLGPLLYRIVFVSPQPGVSVGSQELLSLHIFYLVCSWIFFLAVGFYAIQGSQKICMGLPVRSTAIATWMMLATVSLVVLLQLVTNGAYRVLFFDQHWLSEYWPLLGPLLFLITLILVSHAIYWGLYAVSFTRAFCWTVSIVGLFWWFISRYFPNGFRADAVSWKHVTLEEFFTLFIVSMAAWYWGTREFANVRSGIAVPSTHWQAMRRWWDSLMSGAVSERNAVPASVRSSLSRLHWRDSCKRAVIVYGTLFGIVVLVVNLALRQAFGSTLHQYLDGFLAITLTFSVIAAVLAGIQIGDGICAPGRTEMKQFLATAPLPDHDFYQPLLLNLFKSMISIFLMIQSGMLFSIVMLPLLDGLAIFNADLADLSGTILKYAVYYLFCFWIINANLISIFWTGRTWFIYGLIGGSLGLFGLFIAFGAFLEHYSIHRLGPRTYSPFMYFLIFVFLSGALLLLGSTVLAYITACRKKLIRVSTCLIAFVLWVIGVSLAFYFLNSPPTRPDHVVDLCAILFFVSLCTQFLTPFASIPLALRWNRHR